MWQGSELGGSENVWFCSRSPTLRPTVFSMHLRFGSADLASFKTCFVEFADIEKKKAENKACDFMISIVLPHSPCQHDKVAHAPTLQTKNWRL